MDSWDKARAWIAEKLSDQVFETWFNPVSAVEIKNDRVVLEVPNSFFREWLTNNYLELISEAMLVETGRALEVEFQVAADRDEPVRVDSFAPTPPAGVSKPAPVSLTTRLNPKYTFDNFVVGSSNQLPQAASVAVTEALGRKYNPLFIYGGVGLGKTHLLHAIGNGVRARCPSARIGYLSSEQFMNEFVSALASSKMDVFRRRFRQSCDVLLMDDIQFIAGKDRTQDEFFHTFNSLHNENRQIVLTSDKYPQEIPDLEERLRSRFQWGLIADIQPPELETRLAILKKKSEDERIPLPNDVALFLASSIKSNVRELEGSLINLAAHASLENRRIEISFARETLKKVIAVNQATLTIENVQQTVCKRFGISLSDLRGNRRHRSVSYPRQIAMYLCRKGLGSSYPEIGTQFGGKDHTTALAACRKISRLISEDVEARSKIEAIERMLGF
jgi:chromosomal replication initiator protein